MMMLGIYTKVTQAAAVELVENYWAEYFAAFGINVKPKVTVDPKTIDSEDAFAIPGSHQPKKV